MDSLLIYIHLKLIPSIYHYVYNNLKISLQSRMLLTVCLFDKGQMEFKKYRLKHFFLSVTNPKKRNVLFCNAFFL